MDFVRSYFVKNKSNFKNEPLTSWTLFPHFLAGSFYQSNFLQNPYFYYVDQILAIDIGEAIPLQL